MKKIMTGVTAVCLAAGLAAGQTFRDDMREAGLKNGSKDYKAARAAYQKIAAAYPESACTALREAARCLFRDGKSGEALAELGELMVAHAAVTNQVLHVYDVAAGLHYADNGYGKVLAVCDGALSKYPGMPDFWRARFTATKANALMSSGDRAAAMAELGKAYALAPGDLSVWICRAMNSICVEEGKRGEGQEALRKGILDNARRADVSGLFDSVDPACVSVEQYRDFLRAVILRTPAVEANAKFLGRLKSELEKIRE